MSNIIDNQLRVEGPRVTLELFKNSFAVINNNGEVVDIDLNLLFPVPENLRSDSATEKQKELKNKWKGILWGIATWCNVDDTGNYIPYIKESDNVDVYTFSSSWKGPVAFVEHASVLFDDLNFYLKSEDICNFCADVYTISNGEIISHEYKCEFES